MKIYLSGVFVVLLVFLLSACGRYYTFHDENVTPVTITTSYYPETLELVKSRFGLDVRLTNLALVRLDGKTAREMTEHQYLEFGGRHQNFTMTLSPGWHRLSVQFLPVKVGPGLQISDVPVEFNYLFKADHRYFIGQVYHLDRPRFSAVLVDLTSNKIVAPSHHVSP